MTGGGRRARPAVINTALATVDRDALKNQRRSRVLRSRT
jgi:hypothetical protein